jgi:hypothetical protein
MKIQIVKKATFNAKPQGFCATMIDEPPMAKK